MMVEVCAICDIEGCHHIREADKAPDLSPSEILDMDTVKDWLQEREATP